MPILDAKMHQSTQQMPGHKVKRLLTATSPTQLEMKRLSLTVSFLLYVFSTLPPFSSHI